jgi:hypothetical protein
LVLVLDYQPVAAAADEAAGLVDVHDGLQRMGQCLRAGARRGCHGAAEERNALVEGEDAALDRVELQPQVS